MGGWQGPRLVMDRTARLPSCPMSQTRPIYVASDVHLGAVPEETERAFLAWLHHCGASASRVVLNGDVFDFWFEYRSAIPRGHTRVLGALASLVDAGIPVLLMGGNHDWWGGTFLREEIGIEFHQEPATVNLLGRRTLIAHGDGLGGGDLGYRILKLVLRGRLTRFAFRWLHPDIGAWVARRVSHTSEKPESDKVKLEGRARFLEDWARERLDGDPALDLVILGHSHVPVVKEVEPGRHYLNAGDWVVHRSYAILDGEGPPRVLDWS